MGHVGNTRPTTGSLALSDCSNPFNTINLFTAVCAKVVPYVLVLTPVSYTHLTLPTTPYV